jgi:putative DNA primase/helicase
MWKKWLVWDGTRWVVDEGNRVEALAKDGIVQIYKDAQHRIRRVEKLIEDHGTGNGDVQKQREKEIAIATATLKWALKSESADKLAGMLKHAHSERGIAITPEQLDGNPWILNCRNGTVDLQTGQLYKHRHLDLCTKRVDLDYDPDATCPWWDRVLYRIMGGPKDDDEGLESAFTERHERAQRLIKYLQRSVGYSLTGVIREQVLQFMFGSGDNGKSTFSEVLAAMMGDYFQKAPQELLMRKAHHQTGGPSPELARLCGVRLVIAQEVDEKHRLNEAQVKDLTGDDKLTARGLYEDYFEFRPTHKIWMYGNHKPVIVGTDDAIWKRPKLIPFTEKIPKAEQITNLREKYLIPELPGILAWAVHGCLEWQEHGLQVPKEVEVETQKYRNEMDLVSGFLDEKCVSEKLCETLGSDLHAAYLRYIEGDKDAQLSIRKFYARLRERGYDSHPGTGNKTMVMGLKLKPPSAVSTDNAPPEG